MKKRVMIVVLALLILSALLMGCTRLSAEEKAVVGTYEVTELSVEGYPGLTASTYDYFTIEFLSNKKCTVKSKAGVTTYENTAKWKVNDDGEIEVITTKGFATATEKYTLEGDILSGTNSEIVEGQTFTMRVKFTKIKDE